MLFLPKREGDGEFWDEYFWYYFFALFFRMKFSYFIIVFFVYWEFRIENLVKLEIEWGCQ